MLSAPCFFVRRAVGTDGVEPPTVAISANLHARQLADLPASALPLVITRPRTLTTELPEHVLIKSFVVFSVSVYCVRCD